MKPGAKAASGFIACPIIYHHIANATGSVTVIIEAYIPEIETIFTPWKIKMGHDYVGYKNHVYRMIHFCFALHEHTRGACNEVERQKIIIAGCFHDIGIWSDNTIDYLPPSIAVARAYLQEQGQEEWSEEIALMIEMHHKVQPYRDARYPLVETFRQGDLVDFSLGLVRCGLPATTIHTVRNSFPNAGFHKRLVQLELRWVARHPLNPFPIFKW